MKRRIKKWLQKWLGMTTLDQKQNNLQENQQALKKELVLIRKAIRNVEDSAIIGVDLGYRDLSEVIIIKYSAVNSAFKVIANTESKFEHYNRFVNEMRRLCDRHNASIIAIDAPRGMPDLRSRILPDKALMDDMKERI